MPFHASPRAKGALRKLVAAVALAAVLVAGTYAALSVLAGWKSADTALGWEQSLGTREEIFARWPREDANAEALTVERLAAAIGVDIAPRWDEDRARPSAEAREDYGAAGRVVQAYLASELTRADAGLEPPGEELAAFLAARRGELDALRAQLVGGATPRWEMHLEDLWEAPIPNLLGHINLQRLLVADALARAAAGDGEAALAGLDASWRLNASLRDSPILITQLIAVAVTRMQAGALRHVGLVPSSWRERLAEHDYRASLLESLRYEGWIWTTIDDLAEIDLGDGFSSAAGLVARPYLGLCIADSSERWRRAVDRLAAARPRCGVPADESGVWDPAPRWNAMDSILVPNMLDAVDRVTRLELDLELTDLWLALQDGPGDGSVTLAASDACPEARWTYETGGDGATIALDRELEWPDHAGIVLPTRIVAPGADSDA